MAKRQTRARNHRTRMQPRAIPRARSTSAAAKARKRGGPIPGTPNRGRFAPTPEVLADCRRRYETTADTNAAIARGYGIDETKLRRLAKREGWTRQGSRSSACCRRSTCSGGRRRWRRRKAASQIGRPSKAWLLYLPLRLFPINASP